MRADLARPKPTPYARLMGRTLDAMERAGKVFNLCDGTGRLLGRCPACATGAVTVQVLDDPPRVRTHGCSAGCTPELVAEAVA